MTIYGSAKIEPLLTLYLFAFKIKFNDSWYADWEYVKTNTKFAYRNAITEIEKTYKSFYLKTDIPAFKILSEWFIMSTFYANLAKFKEINQNL